MNQEAKTKTEVKILKADVVVDGRVCKKGDRVRVGTAEADRLVAEGSAAHATEVQAIRDNVLVGNRVAKRGEVVATSGEIAATLVERGTARYYSAGMEGKPLPPDPAPPGQEPADPYAGMPLVKIKILRESTVGNRVHVPGDVVDAPELRAVQLVAGGSAELHGTLMKLTVRGANFLYALKNRLEDASY